MKTSKITNDDTKKLIMEYLDSANMMQVATISDGKPWICNVWFASDENMNLYWFSLTEARHSQEIAKDSHVAAAVCLPQSPTDNRARGIQLEGTAEVLTNSEDIDIAIECCVGRIFSLEKIRHFMPLANATHRFYRIKPTKFVFLDTANLPYDARLEYIPATNSSL